MVSDNNKPLVLEGREPRGFGREYFKYPAQVPRDGEICHIRGIDPAEPSQIYDAASVPFSATDKWGPFEGVYEWWNNKHEVAHHYITQEHVRPYIEEISRLINKHAMGDFEVTLLWPDYSGPYHISELHKFGVMVDQGVLFPGYRIFDKSRGDRIGGLRFTFSCEPRWLEHLEKSFIEAVENHKNPPVHPWTSKELL